MAHDDFRNEYEPTQISSGELIGMVKERQEKNKNKFIPFETKSNDVYITPTVNIKEEPKKSIQYKYSEDKIVKDFAEYLDSTYDQHYTTKDEEIQCIDAWIAMGSANTSCRDTAMKYLWRYGKKNGYNKADLLKAMHFIVFMLHVDHYRNED